MSDKQGETPTPKRGPGRPPKNPEDRAVALIDQAEVEVLVAAAKAAGFTEGWNACAKKHKPSLFESARQWAIANYTLTKTDMNDGFNELEREYDERLINSDRNLLWEAAQRHGRIKRSLEAPELMTPARRRESREIVDVEEVRLS